MSDSLPIARPAPTGNKLRFLLAFLAGAGCLISLVLMRMSMPTAEPATVLGAPLCGSGDTVNCGYVLNSSWSRIGPLPAAHLGLAYFAFLAVWFGVLGLPNSGGRRWHWLPLVLTTAGVLYSALMIAVMAFVLPVWCTWCVGAHAVNGILFVLTIAAWRRIPKSTDGPMELARPTGLRVGLVLAGSMGMILLTWLAAFAVSQSLAFRSLQLNYLKATNNSAFIAWRHGIAKQHEIPIREDDVSVGPDAAPTTVVIFSDFECAHCADLHRSAYGLNKQFPEQVRFVFKHYPVSDACNPHVETGLHYFACEAARASAAACIADPSKADHYAWDLFKKKRAFSARPYAQLAESVGIDVGAFRAAYESDESAARVAEDIELAKRLGVIGTPTVFLNGRRLSNWRITTDDPKPKPDTEATMALWRHLLGNKPATNVEQNQ